MNTSLKLPPFGKFLDQLKAAGLQTGSARGFWGGVTPDGQIVVTAWTDENDGKGRFDIWRPRTNHGGLKTAWEVGNIHAGAEVSVILLRQRGNVPSGEFGRSIGAAALMPGKWRVVEMKTDSKGNEGAVVEPMPNS
jgi:hypothetical protein